MTDQSERKEIKIDTHQLQPKDAVLALMDNKVDYALYYNLKILHALNHKGPLDKKMQEIYQNTTEQTKSLIKQQFDTNAVLGFAKEHASNKIDERAKEAKKNNRRSVNELISIKTSEKIKLKTFSKFVTSYINAIKRGENTYSKLPASSFPSENKNEVKKENTLPSSNQKVSTYKPSSRVPGSISTSTTGIFFSKEQESSRKNKLLAPPRTLRNSIYDQQLPSNQPTQTPPSTTLSSIR